MRAFNIERNTAETKIILSVSLDGKGESDINSGCGFLDHMLTLFSKHSGVDLTVKCKGDINVDYHHTTEDIAICLGLAIKQALGDKKGISRYGSMILPMDEALILSAIDLSGRSFFVKELNIPATKVGDFDTELCEEFFQAFARCLECNLHIRQLSGSNSHHIIEGVFKSVARSLKQAIAIDLNNKDQIPSTKGVL